MKEIYFQLKEKHHSITQHWEEIYFQLKKMAAFYRKTFKFCWRRLGSLLPCLWISPINFCELKSHNKFYNPRTSPFGERSNQGGEKEEKITITYIPKGWNARPKLWHPSEYLPISVILRLWKVFILRRVLNNEITSWSMKY